MPEEVNYNDEGAVASLLQGWTKDAKSLWAKRDARWSLYRRMIAQSYKQYPAGYENIISNEAKVQLERAVDILSGRMPIIRVPIVDQDPEQKSKISRSERFADGILQEVHDRWRRKGHGSWLRELCYYVAMGAYAVFPHIEKNNGDTQFKCDIFDPIQVYPVPGEDGWLRVIRTYTLLKDQAVEYAKNMEWDYEKLKDGRMATTNSPTAPEVELVELVNCWWMLDGDVMNALIIGGQVINPVEKQDFKRIPILVSTAKGVPYREYQDSTPQLDFPFEAQGKQEAWQTQWAQSVFDGQVRTQMEMDRLLTYNMAIVGQHAKAPWLHKTDTGDTTLTAEDTKSATVIGLETGDSLERLKPPAQPQETRQMQDYFQGALQRSGMGHATFGEFMGDMAAITLKRLNDLSRTHLQPYINCVEEGIADILYELFDQFKRGRLGKVTLEVREKQEGARLQYQLDSFSKDDLPQTLRLKTKLPLSLPDDRLAQYTAVRQVIPGPTPLMSRLTAFDEHLNVQDPMLEENRIISDIVNAEMAQELGYLRALREYISEREQAAADGDEGAAVDAEIATLKLQALVVNLKGKYEQAALPNDQRARQREPSPEAGGGAEVNALAGGLVSEGNTPSSAEFGASGSRNTPAESPLQSRLRRAGLFGPGG